MNSIRYISLARKANRLAIGEDETGNAAHGHTARLILLAADASENAKNRAESYSYSCSAPLAVLSETKDVLGAAVGRGTPAMLAMTDIGIAAAYIKELSSEFPGKYDVIADAVLSKAETIRLRKEKTVAERKGIRPGKRRK